MHYSVLLDESITNLNIKEDGIYVDGTLGYAGHSSEILKRIKKGKLFAFDQDEEAIVNAKEKLNSINSNFEIIHSNFVNMKSELNKRGITKVDGILFDLGLSSPQIDNVDRGFTFMHEAMLDMRMDKNNSLTAYSVVNNYSYGDLLNIFYTYGEEQKSKDIAKGIIKCREEKKINTTLELVEIIKNNVGAKYFNAHHPERQIFQAIRIEVNNELKVLESVLPDAIDLLKPNGRLCVITFHSLEDRIVKQIFKKNSEINNMVKGLPVIPNEYKPKIVLINKKPILPSEKEIRENSRSKSAKLRVAERID